jgi:hypothetical protein
MFILYKSSLPYIRMQDLKNLQEKKLNNFTLHLGEIKQLRLSGWKGFKLYLKNSRGWISEFPVIKGIYSMGGKDGVQAWMDVEYIEELEFSEGKNSKDTFSVDLSYLNRKLFRYLGNIIPPGGHLMVSYEGEQKIHTVTRKSLSLGIPPVLTPLGILIFLAGFQYTKDWYLAEGGHEGPRKLWGEKAPDANWEKVFFEKTVQQIKQFFKKKSSTLSKELVESTRKRAKEIQEFIRKI